MTRPVLLALLFASCVTPPSFFPCTSNSDCTVDGVCEPSGFCSFVDPACQSGRRYGDASGDGLANECVPHVITCGDGMIEAPEECEDGNSVATDSCVNCMYAKCGDGAVRTGIEDCDDGNTVDGDACNSICLTCAGDASGVYGGHCYMRIDAPVAWMSAATDCVTRGGTLVSLNTAGENAFVTTLVTGASWIGLDDFDETQFYWQDDERPTTYANWTGGEPNGGVAENCVSMAAATGTWSDAVCTGVLPYVCERVPWTIDPMTRHAYRYTGGVAELMYGPSVAACANTGAHLATITTPAENMVVDAITSATSTTIGLNDVAAEGTYVWETGEAFSFTAWATAANANELTAQPDGVLVPTDDCAVVQANGQWSDGSCTRNNGYLCEIDP